MLRIALKMLFGDHSKLIGILIGLTFASLLITQQSAIFIGLMARTHGFISDTGGPDLWVMDPHVENIDDIKPMLETAVLRVRGVPGVEWAMPMFRGVVKARMPDGDIQKVVLVGLDDATLIGGPPRMLEGNLIDLKQDGAVIFDYREGKDKLLKPSYDGNGKMVPLEVGDTIEINDRRAIIVGRANNTPTFQQAPTIYTTYSRALGYAPFERRRLSYILVGVKPGYSQEQVAKSIQKETLLKALTQKQFETITWDYYFEKTGIPENFGIAVALGFIVGIAIAGQMFYNFTIDNLRYFGTLKAMGANKRMLIKMISVEAFVVGIIGYGIGVGLAAVLGLALEFSDLAFKLTWKLLGISALSILVICVVAALVSVQRILRLELADVFRS